MAGCFSLRSRLLVPSVRSYVRPSGRASIRAADTRLESMGTTEEPGLTRTYNPFSGSRETAPPRDSLLPSRFARSACAGVYGIARFQRYRGSTVSLQSYVPARISAIRATKATDHENFRERLVLAFAPRLATNEQHRPLQFEPGSYPAERRLQRVKRHSCKFVFQQFLLSTRVTCPHRTFSPRYRPRHPGAGFDPRH